MLLARLYEESYLRLIAQTETIPSWWLLTHPYTASHPSLAPLSLEKGLKEFCHCDTGARPRAWPFLSPSLVPFLPSHVWRKVHGRFVQHCSDRFLFNPVHFPINPNTQRCFYHRRPRCFQTFNSKTSFPSSSSEFSAQQRVRMFSLHHFIFNHTEFHLLSYLPVTQRCEDF